MSAAARPPLPKLAKGDTVYVVRSYNDMRRRTDGDRYIPAEVVSVARVWVTLRSTGDGRPQQEWRMRLDTQNDASRYPGSSERFVTPDQAVWEIAGRQAGQYLREQGLTVERNSPWHGREVELAEALKRAVDA